MSTEPSDPTEPIVTEHVDVGAVRLHVRRAGHGGRLVVLLHGWPQTGYCWRHLVPSLADTYTVVAPDLRGYGDSTRPPHGYDKRTMARDVSTLIDRLGFVSAHVVGHDRGARVAHRLAIDRPDQVDRLALLDILPSHHVMANVDAGTARTLWHWFFHAQPELPELLITPNVDAYLRFFFERQAHDPRAIGAGAVAEYVRAFSNPASVRASLEDYRAAFAADRDDDAADVVAQRRVTAPTLVLWGANGGLGGVDPIAIWDAYATDVRGHAIRRCKHFLPEERPREVLDALEPFLST